MIIRSEAQKQMVPELLWILWFDEKIISNVYVSISRKKYSNLCYDMTQRKQSEQEATTYSLYSLLFMYFMGLCVVILFKNKRFMLDEMPLAKNFKVCHIFFLHFMLHKYYSITFSNSRPLVYINIGHLLEKWQILKHFNRDISSSINL